MLLVGLVHDNLMVACERIHEGHHLVTCRVINQMINVWHLEEIFRTSFIQISEVDTQSLGYIGLLNKYSIRNPLWIVDFFYQVIF